VPSLRVVLDEAACQGHGRCYSLAPDVYDTDDEGHCVIKTALVGEELAAQARSGAANCPERALSVEAAD
jgi:ferredoxin